MGTASETLAKALGSSGRGRVPSGADAAILSPEDVVEGTVAAGETVYLRGR